MKRVLSTLVVVFLLVSLALSLSNPVGASYPDPSVPPCSTFAPLHQQGKCVMLWPDRWMYMTCGYWGFNGNVWIWVPYTGSTEGGYFNALSGNHPYTPDVDAAAMDAAGAHEDRTYQAPNSGVFLTWTDTWQASSAWSAPQSEGVSLISAHSYLLLEMLPDTTDLATCTTAQPDVPTDQASPVADQPEASVASGDTVAPPSAATPLADSDAEWLSGDGIVSEQNATLLTEQDGSQRTEVIATACELLPAGGMLRITHVANTEDLATERPLVMDLLLTPTFPTE